jgi:hypothetical protein
MDKILTNKLMNILIGITYFTIIIGTFFKIQHYPYGNLLLILGFLAYLVLSNAEIQRLRQIIKEKENREV